MKYKRQFILALLLFAFSSSLMLNCSGISLNESIKNAEGDWLMAGGGTKQQNVSGFVLEPPLDLKWSFNIDAGIGYSAISISDAAVFVNCLAGDMISFDISSGNKLGKITFLGKEANTNPLIINNNAILSFAGNNDNSLVSYDLGSGLINWKINLGFLQTSPILKDGFIYVSSLGGNFYKVDSRSDSVYWKYDAGTQIHSTCAIEENKAVFGADNGYIYCININDGSLIWKTKAGAPVVAAPMIFENKVFAGSYDSNYYCLNIEDGKIIWNKNMSTKILSGSSVSKSGDILFGGVNGILYSLKSGDGSENWRVSTKGPISSSPMCSGANIYFTSYDFYVYCVEGSTGKELWKFEMEGKSKTTPVIWKDYLVVAADKVVYCFSKGAAVK